MNKLVFPKTHTVHNEIEDISKRNTHKTEKYDTQFFVNADLLLDYDEIYN
jgi:hypothetical protein